MANSRRNQRDYKQGKSLRKSSGRISEGNVDFMAAFITVALASRLGVYVKVAETTGSCRLKVYDQDETYEDNLLPGEPWDELLVDYAVELGLEDLVEQAFSQVRRRHAERPPEARKRRGGTLTPEETLPEPPRDAERP